MIIKSMSRKEPSFGQLIEYMSDIDKSDQQYNVYQNLYSRKQDDIKQEFLRNAVYVAKRKNGNYLYHEILSITKAKKLDNKRQKEILRHIAHEYTQRRAAHNLVFGTLHDDHDEHLHYHLLISANISGDSKKTRLAKSEFDKIKKELESRVLKKYPELEQTIVINKQANEKLSNKGSKRKRRTGEIPQIDSVKNKLQNIFSQAESKQTFFDALDKGGFEIYVRGKTVGILDKANNRKHRLKTLGILEEFETMSVRINLDEAANKQQERASKSTIQKNKADTSAKSESSEPEINIKTEAVEKQAEKNQDEILTEADKIKSQHQEEMETIRKAQSNSKNQTSKGSKK